MKDKLLLCIIMTLVSINLAWGQGQFLTGKGKYVAQEGEKLSFIKEQLLYEAAKDIITQQMQTMHFDANLFWNQYDLKFAEFFAEAKKELMEKKGFSSEEEAAKDSKFQEQLRHRKRYLLSRFGRLKKVLASYVIKRMSHSSKFNKVYHITILAKVNRKVLSRKYAEFTQGRDGIIFKTLYLRTAIKLNNLAWPELGVEVVSDFKKVVFDYWAAWLNKNFQGVVEKVVIVDDTIEQQLLDYQQMSAAALMQNSPFVDSVLLNTSYDITKLAKNEIFHSINYEIDGRINFVDLNDQRVISFADMAPISFAAQTSSDYELSSHVATNLYKYPLPTFIQSLTEMKQYNVHQKNLTITVENVESVKDIFLLKKFLETMGIALQVDVKLNLLKVVENKAQLKIWIGGTIEQFNQFFLSLNQKQLRNKLLLNTSVSDGVLKIKLISID